MKVFIALECLLNYRKVRLVYSIQVAEMCIRCHKNFSEDYYVYLSN